MRERLEKTVAAVAALDRSLAPKGQAHLDNLTKPRGSLGRLEELALRLYMIQEGAPPAVDPARIYTIAGDHGVAGPEGPGVSLFPQEVTRQMVLNFVHGGAGVNVLSRVANVELRVVDAGSVGQGYPESPGLMQRKVAPGTADLSQGPAMTAQQCLQALCLGLDLAEEAHASGCRAVATGDMGIGNTTASTALYCAYLGLEPAEVAGPGTGLPPEGVARKVAVIEQALTANARAVASGDPLAVLTALGGLEIAALAGLIIGGAARRMAVAVDGFISTAAYVAAWKLCPDVEEYCFFSHASAEQGHQKIMQALGGRPLLDLGMRLGEGTGAALALFLLRAAAAVFNQMATFQDAGVTASD